MPGGGDRITFLAKSVTQGANITADRWGSLADVKLSCANYRCLICRDRDDHDDQDSTDDNPTVRGGHQLRLQRNPKRHADPASAYKVTKMS